MAAVVEDVVTVVAAIEAEVDGLADDAFDRPLVPYVWNISRNKKSQPMGGRCALGDDPESRPRGRACPPPASRRTDPGQRQCRTRWPGRCRSEPRQPNPAPSTLGPSRQSADSHQAGASIAGRRRISPRTVRLPSVSPLAVDPLVSRPAVEIALDLISQNEQRGPRKGPHTRQSRSTSGISYNI